MDEPKPADAVSSETQPGPAADPVEAREATPRDGLASPSFVGLLLTQFLGAMNDNMFRLLAIGIGTEYVVKNQSSTIVAAGLACFTLPYLLLAAPAGYLADRFSKRQVIVLCKVAEIVVMALAIGAIYMENLYL